MFYKNVFQNHAIISRLNYKWARFVGQLLYQNFTKNSLLCNLEPSHDFDEYHVRRDRCKYWYNILSH